MLRPLRQPWALIFVTTSYGLVHIGTVVLPLSGFAINLTLMVALPLTLCVFMWSLTKLEGRHWRQAIQACLTFFPILVGFWLGFHFRARQEQASMRVGDTIVEALNRYKAERGEMPESLDALVPAYLQAIPKTGMAFVEGQDFRYYHGALWFKRFPWKNSNCYYDYQRLRWENLE